MTEETTKDILEQLHDCFLTMYHRTENENEKKGIARCLTKVTNVLKAFE